ncbi:MAG: aspartate--tRNA(Asn) ligase [Candidatus Paceibacterota bacterium]
MKRIYINELKNHIDKEVKIAGWVDSARDHGKLTFLDIRDRTGVIQSVVTPKEEKAHNDAQKLHAEWVVEVTGTVKKRPENMVNDKLPTGDIELGIEDIVILSPSAELPFDKNGDINLDTYFDYLPLTLRTQKGRDIFTVQATILEAYRKALIDAEFIEFQSPALVGEDAEGGAAAFKVAYYNEKTAFLATSPQLYKEIMTGVFEKVFTIAKIFRGEKHATTRHLSEITQMDFELAFIKDHTDVMSVLEHVIRKTVERVIEKHLDVFTRFGIETPILPKEEFPSLKLTEAQEILKKEFSIDAIGEPDLEPEHERKIGEWACKEHGSDFVFITHFPTAKRAFYTYPDPDNPTYSRSFDLLFRGLEINSGSQRYHNYEHLIKTLKERGLDPEKFSFYLQMHKYGIPPHGGCSTGLERFTARMLELPNVKLATPFPRDMHRIDTRLSDNDRIDTRLSE